MKTILVLTAIERAFYSATIEYQLIDPILRIAKGMKNTRFIFLALIPFPFYFIRGEERRTFGLFRKRRKELRERLRKKGIRIIFFPVLYPLKHRSFYLTPIEVPLFIRANLPVLLIFQAMLHPAVIHARGYPAALLAYVMKRLKRTRFIFDMRDVYPLKGIEAGIFRREGAAFRLWSDLELRMLNAADAVIVTSRPFKTYVEKKLSRDRKIWCIPNSVSKNRFFENPDIREIVRKGMGVSERFVLVHSGTFSTPGDVSLAVKYFKKWKEKKPDSFFLILTPNKRNAEKIQRVFIKKQISDEDFKILTPEPEKVPDLLRAGDVGLHLESQALATEYCIAIKDGEYLASGLPVICTPHLKGIAPLIEEYRCGMVIDPERDDSFEREMDFLANYKKFKQNTKMIIEKTLSIDNAAEVLSMGYGKLI